MKTITNKATVIAVAATVLSLQSCATMFTGSRDSIQFSSSQHPGATVKIDGVDSGKTPCTVMVKKKSKIVTYEMEGYQSKTFELAKALNGVTFLNAIFILPYFFPALIGGGVDVATGAVNKFTQKSYDVNLEPATRNDDRTTGRR